MKSWFEFPCRRRTLAALLHLERLAGGDAHHRRNVSTMTPPDSALLQVAAVNRTVEAVARGQDRILLVMATGTGQAPHLAASGACGRPESRTPCCFLASHVLVDQTRTNDLTLVRP